MEPSLLTRPWRLLATRWPWTSTAYLVVQVIAGWVGVVATATVVWLPAWARVWSNAERRLVTLAGHPAIVQRPSSRAGGWELLHVLVTIALSLLGTVAAAVTAGVLAATLFAPLSVIATGQVEVLGLPITSPLQQLAAAVVGVVILTLVLWGATATAWTLARLSHLVLGSNADDLQNQVTALSTAALQAQDSLLLERRALERELHDGAQLHLAAAAMALGLLELDLQALPPDARAPILADLRDAREHLDNGIDSVRTAAHDLVPHRLIDEGLGPALTELATGLPLHVTAHHDVPPLPQSVQYGLYLISSEAVTNVLKHSAASELHLACHPGNDGGVRLEITDNGRGGADPSGSGILGMRARAATIGATLDITSPDGGPTTITVHRPDRTPS